MKEADLKEMCRISMIGFVVMTVLFFFFILSSCGSNKLATKSDSSIQNSEQTSVSDTTSVKHNERSKEEENTTEVTITTKTEYDTDKPVDANTGKPPIKSEETTTKKKETSKKTETSSETDTNKGVTADINRKENSIQKNEVKKEKEESTLFKQIGWCVLSIVLLFVSSYFLYRKLKKEKGKGGSK